MISRLGTRDSGNKKFYPKLPEHYLISLYFMKEKMLQMQCRHKRLQTPSVGLQILNKHMERRCVGHRSDTSQTKDWGSRPGSGSRQSRYLPVVGRKLVIRWPIRKKNKRSVGEKNKKRKGKRATFSILKDFYGVFICLLNFKFLFTSECTIKITP